MQWQGTKGSLRIARKRRRMIGVTVAVWCMLFIASSAAVAEEENDNADKKEPQLADKLERTLKKAQELVKQLRQPKPTQTISLAAYPPVEKNKNKTYVFHKVSGSERIRFIDLHPNLRYTIATHYVSSPPGSIEIDDLEPLSGGEGLDEGPCAPIKSAIDNLKDASSPSNQPLESEIPTAAFKLELTLDIHSADCNKTTLLNWADALLARTRHSKLIEFDIEPGTVVKVVIKTSDGRQATYKFVGPKIRFFQSYGIAYLRDKNKRYFTEENDDGSFTIHRASDRSDWEPAGLLLLNYVVWRRSPWTLSGAGALAINSDERAVGLGLNITLDTMLGVVAGIAINEQTRLRGQYEEGMKVKSALEGEQLTRDVHSETLFVGLSLRLGSNPFAKDKKAEETDAE